MKAAYYHGNRTIKVGECRLRAPAADEVRINVAYCGVCGTDLHIFKGGMDKRVTMPQVIGHEMSGEIAEVGDRVKDWSKGDRVVVRPLDPCGNCPACDNCYIFCPDAAITPVKNDPQRLYIVDTDYCKGCGICEAECPRACIVMKAVR